MFLDFTFITHVGLRCTCPCCWLDKTVPRYPKAQVQVSDIPNVLKLAHDLLGPDVADITTAVASRGSRALDLFYLIYALLYWFLFLTFCTLAFLSIIWFVLFFVLFEHALKEGYSQLWYVKLSAEETCGNSLRHMSCHQYSPFGAGYQTGSFKHRKMFHLWYLWPCCGHPLTSVLFLGVICFSHMLLYDYLTL